MRYFDQNGNAIPAPKSRTFASIRKASMAATARRNSAPHSTGKDHLARRAFQYANAIAGLETGHSINLPCKLETFCIFRPAPDGSNRVFQVLTDAGRVSIPHWDFTPDMQADIFA